ncbi:unnamed protein product [Mytilus coruscus]|uniref:Claudin n=1 Tax=Mytilus coruscus TaxID=42192 RepID=A0A6J8F0A1_MYTCO|nr:unnamed protein product [Mytilus coruscus]
MERRKHKGLAVVGFLFSLTAFVAHGVASYLPYWYGQSVGDNSVYGGLWQLCSKFSGKVTCSDITSPWEDDKPWYVKTCQGLAMGASLLTFIGVIIFIVKLCKGKEPGCTSAYPVSRVLFFIGGLMIFGVTGVWSAYQEDFIKENKSFAYWIEWSAGVLFIVSAILLAIRKYAPSDPYRNPTAQSNPNMTPTAQIHLNMTPAAQPYQNMPPAVQAYPYIANQGFARY